jgi:hypothetical protein
MAGPRGSAPVIFLHRLNGDGGVEVRALRAGPSSAVPGVRTVLAGLPVLATPLGSVFEAVQDGITGILTPGVCSQRLATAFW